MYLKDINDKKWKVSKDLNIIHNALSSLGSEEQECHINVGRADDTAEIDCTYGNWITKLSKSEHFILTEVLVSSSVEQKGYLLGIKGMMPKKSVRVAFKRRV